MSQNDETKSEVQDDVPELIGIKLIYGSGKEETLIVTGINQSAERGLTLKLIRGEKVLNPALVASMEVIPLAGYVDGLKKDNDLLWNDKNAREWYADQQ